MSLFSKKPDPDFIPIVNDPPRNLHERAPRGLPYGIAETIQLLRTVPVEQNVELVMAVIRGTLESLNVRLADIVEDATSREKALHQRIETLKSEMAEYEKQIDAKGQEIARLQSERAETVTAKERLLAVHKGPSVPAPAPAPAPAAAPPPRREGGVPPIPPQLKVPGPAPSAKAIQALQAVQDDPE